MGDNHPIIALMPLASYAGGFPVFNWPGQAIQKGDPMRAGYRSIVAILALLAAAGAHAQQAYPSRPVRLIVPFPPGGGADIVARVVAQKATESFGVPVVVDNRPGAAGMIGTELAVRASADGYTTIMVEGGYTANAAVYKLTYDPLSDLVPIALVGETGFIVTLHSTVPVKSIRELIAYDKTNSAKLNYGSGGTGSSNHLVTELFNQMAGTKLTHVPYKGIGLALNDLLGGQIQLIFGGLPPMLPHIKSNRLRGIAVTTEKRSNAAPDIPTVAETVPGYEAPQWFGILGPKALPKEVVARWNREVGRVVQLPDVEKRMAGEGLAPAGGSPERFHGLLKREIARWQEVVKTANIKPGS
jgi:tripartite-type tricarboxylate transporter receptor subunit TctC